MIKSVLAKIKNNIWLFICLIIGSLLITSILASIPIYTDGALRKMLKNDINAYQTEKGVSAGQIYTAVYFGDDYTAGGIIAEVGETDEYINTLFKRNGVKYTDSFERLTMGNLISDIFDESIVYNTNYKIESMTGVEDHISIISGRMYDDETYSGIYLEEYASDILEAVVTSSTFNNCNLALDRVYKLTSFPPDSVSMYVKVVGVYEPKYEDNSYWYDANSSLGGSFMISSKVMKDFGLQKPYASAITISAWFRNIDFSGLQVNDLGPFIRTYNALDEYLDGFGVGKTAFKMPAVNILSGYLKRADSMRLTMWVLIAPILVMLAFYTFMVSKLIVEEDSNEISSMKSRGARPGQIFSRYIIECAFISIFSLILGPPLAMFLSQVIGSANGFLEFVNRSRLELHLLPEAYLYSLAAAVIFTVMVLIPAYRATKDTIVQHKQKKARKRKRPLWEVLFLDVILLGVSIYLLFLYKRLGTSSTENGMDPVVYFISTLFIIGAGLLFLRLYPLVVALIFRITKKKLPPTLYSAIVQVFRAGNDNRFLMMFLILTIALGVYSSSSARIINTNVENTALYNSGADIVLSPSYDEDIHGNTTTHLSKLPIGQYQELEGVETVTKVAKLDYCKTLTAKTGYWEDITVMAIEPYSFAKTSWLSDSLNDVHWYNYINMMEEYPTTVLLSRNVAKMLGASEGSTVEVDINYDADDNFKTFKCYVIGIIDYWPTFSKDTTWNGEKGDLLVMNIRYLQSISPDVVYDIWIDKKDGVSSEQIYAEMEEKGLTSQLSKIQDRSTFTTAAKNDSLLKALNGSFSLGFIATMIISMIGFLIYWIMNIRKRKLQFGILRAMGMTRGKVTLMLLWEHLMTTGVSVLMGMAIGNITVKLFVPLLQIAYGDTTLPLELVTNSTDKMRVYFTVFVMLIAGIAILAGFINKLKINEAVKIGED